MRHFQGLILTVGFFCAGLSFAGVLEEASEVAYRLERHTKCARLDIKSLAKNQNICTAKAANPKENEKKAVGAIAEKTLDSIEAPIFKKMAQKSVAQLKCAADFANAANSDEKTLQMVLLDFQNLSSIGQAYQGWLEESQRKYHSCPSTQKELDQTLQLGPSLSFPKETQSTYRRFCQRGLNLQKGWYLSRSLIPLGNMPSVAKLIQPKLGQGLQFQVSADQVKTAYREAQKNLENEARSMQQKSTGVSELTSYDKRALYADSALIQEVFDGFGSSSEVNNLYCHLNARYGQGAQDLNKDLFIGQLGFAVATLGTGAFAESLLWVDSVAAARAGGFISNRFLGALAFDTALVGTNFAVNWGAVEESCQAYKVQVKSKKAGICAQVPSVLQVQSDSCGLAVLLAGLDIPSPLVRLVRNTKLKVAEIKAAQLENYGVSVNPLTGFRSYRVTGGRSYPVKPPSPIREKAIEEFNSKTGRKLFLKSEKNSLEILDSKSGKEAFSLRYEVGHEAGTKEDFFHDIHIMSALDEKNTDEYLGIVKFLEEYKGQGFSSMLFHKMVANHPDIKLIKTDLMHDNAFEVNRLVRDEGYSIEEAIKGTPSFRVYQQNGFTEIDPLSIKYLTDSAGNIRQVSYSIRKTN